MTQVVQSDRRQSSACDQSFEIVGEPVGLYPLSGRACKHPSAVNLTALREVGFTANRRLLHVEHISHDPAAGQEAFTAVTAPADIGGQHAAGLPFGDPRAQALLAVLLVFRLQPNGFTNADLRSHLTQLLGVHPGTWSAGRATTTCAGSACTD